MKMNLKINSRVCVFTKGDDAILNKVMQYVKIMSLLKIKIVNVKREGSESNDSLIIDLKVLDRAYPEIAIEFIELEGVDPKSSMN
jgi:hypothetical protein